MRSLVLSSQGLTITRSTGLLPGQILVSNHHDHYHRKAPSNTVSKGDHAVIPKPNTSANAVTKQQLVVPDFGARRPTRALPMSDGHLSGPWQKKGTLLHHGAASVHKPLEPAVDWSLGGWADSPGADDAVKVPRSSGIGAHTSSDENHNPNTPLSHRRPPATDAASNLPTKRELRVTAVGAQCLSSSLSENPGGNLVTLSLNNNSLGSAGAECIFEALHANFTLKTLLLRWRP